MANPPDDLRDMDLKGLIKKLKLDDDNFDEWLKDLGLLHRGRKCPYGDHEMKLRKKDGRLKWMCRKRDHCKSQPVLRRSS
jgi:hypothetical protein